jgi:hypothetical protein
MKYILIKKVQEFMTISSHEYVNYILKEADTEEELYSWIDKNILSSEILKNHFLYKIEVYHTGEPTDDLIRD